MPAHPSRRHCQEHARGFCRNRHVRLSRLERFFPTANPCYSNRNPIEDRPLSCRFCAWGCAWRLQVDLWTPFGRMRLSFRQQGSFSHLSFRSQRRPSRLSFRPASRRAGTERSGVFVAISVGVFAEPALDRVRWASCGGRSRRLGRRQISPFRCASVEMTRGGSGLQSN